MKDQEQTAQMPTPTSPQVPAQKTDPNTELYQWLDSKGYELVTNALTNKTPFLGEHGFVLTDKPLLVVQCRKKENNN